MSTLFMTRATRNNNPLNIRKNPNITWDGQAVLQDDKEFVSFVNPVWGFRAATRILKTYKRRYNIETLRDIISRWAPPSENDTENYIRYVANSTGIPENQPIKEQHYPALLKAMAKMEGNVIYDIQVARQGVALA